MYPAVKTLIFGLTETRGQVLRYIEAGADGYVTKDDSAEQLVDTIRAVNRGRAHISPEMAAVLMERLGSYAQLFAEIETRFQQEATLTPREREILNLVARGLTNPQIADELVIEVGTVKNHVHSILGKLGVSRREEAAAYLALMKQDRSV
jgi:DNA-binding NarL/FixJ family response regulator